MTRKADPQVCAITFPPFHGSARDVAERLRVMAACTHPGRTMQFSLSSDQARQLARFLDSAMTIAEGQQSGVFMLRTEAEARIAEIEAAHAATSAAWDKAREGCDATLLKASVLFGWAVIVLLAGLAGVIVAVLA